MTGLTAHTATYRVVTAPETTRLSDLTQLLSRALHEGCRGVICECAEVRERMVAGRHDEDIVALVVADDESGGDAQAEDERALFVAEWRARCLR